ncbi:MAG: MFS transporter [Chlamydiae bacterium]|nr:MFS transporter [Chlamydiota bacterium]
MKLKSSSSVIFLLLCTLFISTFCFTSTNITELYVISELGGSTNLATYTISFFAIGSLSILPFTTYMIRSMGIKKSILFCLASFFLSNLLSIFCTNEYQALILRFIQGASAGPLFPLSICCINFYQEPDKKIRNSIFVVLITIMTPPLGSAVGGWLSYNYHWEYVFTIPCFLTLTLFIFLYELIQEEIPIPKCSFNGFGFVLYFISCVCILSGITVGQFLDWDRSNLVMFLLIFGGLTLVMFCLWNIRQENPIINLKLFKSYNFALSTLCFGIIFCNYIGTVLLLANWLNIDVTYTPDWIGLLTLHMVFPAILIFIFKNQFIKLNPKKTILVAVLLFTASAFFTTTFSEDIDFRRIALARITTGFALALIPSAIGRLMSENSAVEEGYNNVLILQIARNLGGCLGASVYLQMFWRRSVFYHDRLGSQLTVFSEQTDFFFMKAKLIGLKGLQAQGELDQQLQLQSSALALDDCFYFMGWVFVSVFIWLVLSILVEKYFAKKTNSTQLTITQ